MEGVSKIYFILFLKINTNVFRCHFNKLFLFKRVLFLCKLLKVVINNIYLGGCIFLFLLCTNWYIWKGSLQFKLLSVICAKSTLKSLDDFTRSFNLRSWWLLAACYCREVLHRSDFVSKKNLKQWWRNARFRMNQLI